MNTNIPLKFKKCDHCKEKKPVEEFYFKKNTLDGLNPTCKNCKKEFDFKYRLKNKEKIKKYFANYEKVNFKKLKQYRDNYYEKNKDVIKLKRKSHYENNKNSVLKCQKKYYQKNKTKIKISNEKYREKNKDEIRKKQYIRKKERLLFDVNFKIKENLRHRIYSVLYNKYNKSNSTSKLIGCSLKELKDHLESQFKEGMSWDNYGKNGWHIDHILPCALFDLTDPEQQRKCFHYTNLQPLWAADNLSKGAKIPSKD